MWSRDGRELFYLSADLRLMAVSMQTGGAGFSSGNAVAIHERLRVFTPAPGRTYDVSSDGRRFLLLKEMTGVDEGPGAPRLHVALNWVDELKRSVPRPR